jgi:hypothetical protein
MTIETTFLSMWHSLSELQDVLEALGTTIEEDRPGRDDVIVASRMNDAVLAARGYLEESIAAAADACGAVSQPFSSTRAQRALVRCQEQFHRVADCFTDDLASANQIDDLRTFASERGADWQEWTGVITEALEHCWPLLRNSRNAIFLSWQDLVERMTAPPLSVQAEVIEAHRMPTPAVRAKTLYGAAAAPRQAT